MNARLRRPPITAEKFLRMSDTEGFELVDGRLQEKAMGSKASWIQTRLATRITPYIESPGLGFVLGPEGMYQCFPHKPEQVRKPDVSVVRSGRLPGEVVPDGAITIPPDFVAEVVSPNEKVYRLDAKITDFRRAGVPLIWVVNPDQRTVTVYEGGRIAILTDADTLTGDPVLPGFSVRVADLFPPPADAEPDVG